MVEMNNGFGRASEPTDDELEARYPEEMDVTARRIRHQSEMNISRQVPENNDVPNVVPVDTGAYEDAHCPSASKIRADSFRMHHGLK